MSKNGPCSIQPTATLLFATRTGLDLTTYQLHTEGKEGRGEQGQRKKETSYRMFRARRAQGHTAGMW